MKDTNELLQMIKKSVLAIDPLASLILYGSYARGDNGEDSNIELLILMDKEGRVSYADRCRITAPIHEIELKTGAVISSMIRTKKEWKSQVVSPIYENIGKEGILL